MFTLLMKRLNRTERGASLVEYGLLVVAILVVTVAPYVAKLS
jgi:Flp pilus assembly pilin Flp